MGFSISWLAFEGTDLAKILLLAGLQDTGEEDEANEAPFSLTEIPTGWAILFSNEFSYPAGQRLSKFSVGRSLIACQIEEHVMFSSARCFHDGSEIWSIVHDAQKGTYDLSEKGLIPSQYTEIRKKLFREQDAAGGAKANVDYIFDAPLELAYQICGYRHDRWKFDWGVPRFRRVSPTGL